MYDELDTLIYHGYIRFRVVFTLTLFLVKHQVKDRLCGLILYFFCY